ncbi:hypothetical protein N6H18_11555 [Reichenbachiella agarivorans]|uniref:PKD domain-containing protein n=1 Tax=Reichenbachiella agarivorans TaxID=2979464 RepID=A0ABY6CKD7_9BACT|nr:hypothetical protein [Reichenbachiella agarivorans]UXP30986.1 hypothetical protein N6H18_11555 [Reichenbachiella agarivorans]
MKNILKYIMVLTLLTWVVSACEEEYQAPNDGAKHSVIYASELSAGNQVQVFGDISFGDASAGVKHREWIVPEGIGYIISDDSASSSDLANIKVIFNQAGTFEVKLHQEFDGDFYVGNNVHNATYDTTMMVTVLDSVKMGFTANYLNDDGSLGAALVIADGAKNQLTASKSVRFTYHSEGVPQELVWTYEGGDPETIDYDGVEIADGTADETDVKFKKIGVFDVSLIGSRERPFGADTISFTDIIEVIPSTEPVVLDQLINDGNNIILNYSREIDPNSVNSNDFAVRIENGTVINPSISSVSVDTKSGNLVIVKLSNESLYDDDTVYVSYTPGAMQTTDLVKADAISEMVMEHKKGTNAMAVNGYDVGMEKSTSANWPYLFWGPPYDGFTTSFPTVQPHSGSKSMLMSWTAGGGCIVDHKDNLGTQYTFALEANKAYEFGFWIYIENLGDNTTGDGLVPDLRFYPDDWSAELAFFFDAAFPTGQWVYQSTRWTPSNSRDFFFMMRGYNASSSVLMNFYLDDLGIYELNLRP